MKYKVQLSRRAKDDRANAHDWFAANYSPEFASKWFVSITEAIESLTSNPFRCPKSLESGRFEFELRELLYGTKKNKHRILFTISNDVVVVLHIRHSARRDLEIEDL